MNTDECEERLTKPYKEHLRETLKTVDDYRGYLDACHAEGPETFALAVRDVLEFAATTMRDLCVEKVKELRDNWKKKGGDKPVYAAMWDTADKILLEIQSLTLDQVKEKQS